MTSELIHRLHFAFTITFHYLFPQLTMGLAVLIVVLKSVALKTGGEQWDRAARFWGRIFGINFVFGVVTGIPMEFEFGTNWARFSRLSGGVIGQPLRKANFKVDALVLGGDDLCRVVDFGVLHHRHRRMDAAPRRL
jgi:cytochrome d ubiquinol oxidase subunit I